MSDDMRPRSERLMRTLREKGVDIPQDAILIRTYRGKLQKRAGMWAWEIVIPATPRSWRDGAPLAPRRLMIGSSRTVKELVAARSVALRPAAEDGTEVYIP